MVKVDPPSEVVLVHSESVSPSEVLRFPLSLDDFVSKSVRPERMKIIVLNMVFVSESLPILELHFW